MPDPKITKYFKGVVRSFDPEKKTAEVVISSETKDRYDEIVRVSSFKKTKKEFMKHAVLLSSHAYRGLMNQIGMFKKMTIDEDSKEVVGTIEYFCGMGNPEADWAMKLAEKGIAAFSIGFIPRSYKNFTEEEMKENGGVCREFDDIELLEVSQVLVPANPAALMKSFEAGHQDEKDFFDVLSNQIASLLPEDADGVEWKFEDPSAQDTTTEDPDAKNWEDRTEEVYREIHDLSLFDLMKCVDLGTEDKTVVASYGRHKDTNNWVLRCLYFPKSKGHDLVGAKTFFKEHPEVLTDLSPLVAAFHSELLKTESDEESLAQKIADKISLKLAEIKFVEIPAPVINLKIEADEDETASTEELSTTGKAGEENLEMEELLGVEKLAELRVSLLGDNVTEDDNLRSLFKEMNNEIAEILSVRS